MVNALGLIEVVGLAAGLEAADAATKAANVTLIGYELTKGGGMVVIKIAGNVGAVKAAVDAGTAAAAKIGTVFASHVIPRPGNGLQGIITTKETVGAAREGRAGKKSSAGRPAGNGPVRETAEEVSPEPAAAVSKNTEAVHTDELCNLCGDPACSRRKGDSKTTCIHYKKNHRED